MLATTESVSDVIGGYLRSRFPALAARPIGDDLALLTSGAIDSLGMLELVTFLGERFGIEFADEDFDPANFETLGHLVRFVERARA
jgi:acyl carrier protein